MSGHYITAARHGQRMPGHDVDHRTGATRNVPLEAGKFDLDDYIDYLIGWLEHIGPGAHGGVPRRSRRLRRRRSWLPKT